MIQISRMLGILVGLMFGVIMASFVFTMGSNAEGIASSEMEISNETQMAQLVLYDAVIAYQCTPEKGGYEIVHSDSIGNYWSAWTEYKGANGASANAIDWNNLEAAGSNLECYGASSTLPGSQGALQWDYQNTWLNDQQGKYSRKDFKITKDVQLGPCLAYENGDNGKSGSDPQDVVFLFTDETVANTVSYAAGGLLNIDNTGPDYSFGAGGMDSGECIAPHSGSTNTDSAIVSTVTVIGAGSPDDTYSGQGWNRVGGTPTLGIERGESNFETVEYELCKGTRGYIQTNVGKNEVEKNRPSDYTTNDPPGDPDKEAGPSDPKTNTIHPFIVFTEWNSDC